MNYNERIVSYLHLKQSTLKQMLGNNVKYTSRTDLNEIGTWNEESSKSICAELYSTISEYIEILDDDAEAFIFTLSMFVKGDLCPWCLKFSIECEQCTYGSRHGICRFYSDSNWSVLAQRINEYELANRNKRGYIHDVLCKTLREMREILQGKDED